LLLEILMAPALICAATSLMLVDPNCAIDMPFLRSSMIDAASLGPLGGSG
jgi:hypothetical protein